MWAKLQNPHDMRVSEAVRNEAGESHHNLPVEALAC